MENNYKIKKKIPLFSFLPSLILVLEIKGTWQSALIS